MDSALCADYYETLAPTGLDKNRFACFCMRPALPGELYEMFALPGVRTVWEFGTHNRALYTLACIWCYYYDDGLETYTNDSVWKRKKIFRQILVFMTVTSNSPNFFARQFSRYGIFRNSLMVKWSKTLDTDKITTDKPGSRYTKAHSVCHFVTVVNLVSIWPS